MANKEQPSANGFETPQTRPDKQATDPEGLNMDELLYDGAASEYLLLRLALDSNGQYPWQQARVDLDTYELVKLGKPVTDPLRLQAELDIIGGSMTKKERILPPDRARELYEAVRREMADQARAEGDKHKASLLATIEMPRTGSTSSTYSKAA